jgi:hypothetical protein
MHSIRNSKFILTIALLFAFCLPIAAQEEGFTSEGNKRGEYALVLYAGGGLSYYFSTGGAPTYLQPDLRKFSPVGTVRLMWHPDHLVKVGLETGRMTFLNYTARDSVGNIAKVQTNAVPLLVEWTMALSKRFNLFAGSGVYFLTTNLDYAGKATSKKLSIGWMAAASYIHPLSKNVGLGTELKWMDAAESTDGAFCFQVQLVWKFLRW